MTFFRDIATIALAGVGVYFLLASASWYQGGGIPPPLPPAVLLMRMAGVAGLILAFAVALRAPRESSLVKSAPPARTGASRFVGGTELILGASLVFSSFFVVFPVGCNIASSCPASPFGWWSTFWPNVLTFVVGMMVAAWGLAAARSTRLPLQTLGAALVIDGTVLITLGYSVGYETWCPANGCPPLTAGGWWSLFWPDVIAGVLGVVLIAAGFTLILVSRRRKTRPITERADDTRRRRNEPMHGDVLHPHTRPQEKCSRGKTSKDTSDGTQTEQKLTKKEFEKLSPEIRALVGDKLKGHKDGDAERLVFEQ